MGPDLRCVFHQEDVQERINKVVELARDILPASVSNYNDDPYTQEDVECVLRFIEEAAPDNSYEYTGTNWYMEKGPGEHIRLTSEVARNITIQLNDNGMNLDPNQAVITALLHDLGRFVLHSFYTTDLVTDELFGRIGIDPIIGSSLHKIDWYLGTEVTDWEDTTPYQRISMISDLLGKRSSSDPSRPRDPEKLVQEVRLGKRKYFDNEKNRRPIDGYILERLETYSEREATFITKTLSWLRDMGVSFDFLHNLNLESR